MATIVAFHAHPDDEVLFTGGTLARLAAEGHRVVIVVACDECAARAACPGCTAWRWPCPRRPSALSSALSGSPSQARPPAARCSPMSCGLRDKRGRRGRLTVMATIVAFHAHPDDEAILTGGTLARLAAEGHRVVIVVACDGAMGDAREPGALVRLDE